MTEAAAESGADNAAADAAVVVAAVGEDLEAERGLSATCLLLPLPGQPFRAVESERTRRGSRQQTIDPWRPAQSVDDDEKAPRRVHDKVLEESEGVRACSRRVSQPEWATQQRKLALCGCACVRACVRESGGSREWLAGRVGRQRTRDNGRPVWWIG